MVSPCMVFTSFILLKWSLTALVLNRVKVLLLHIYELLLCLSVVFVILHNQQSIPLPSIYVKYRSPVSSHFGNLHQIFTYARIYFSLTFFLKLVNLFLYILKACTDSNYEFGDTAFKL